MKVFLSYTRNKDQFLKVSAFRERLEAEIGIRAPGSQVFQAKHGIQEGDHFPEVLASELHQSDVLLVLLSPAWLQSDWCRREYALFTDEGANISRLRQILPVLWVDTPEMSMHSVDPVARALASINYADWSELRYTSWDDPANERQVGKLADRAVSLVRSSGQARQPEVQHLNQRNSAALPEFTMIRLFSRNQPQGSQSWNEVPDGEFRRNCEFAADPVFDVMVENKSSSTLVFYRVGIRILQREAMTGSTMGCAQPVGVQSEFSVHCPGRWKQSWGVIDDRTWAEFAAPIEMKKGDSPFRFTLMLENFCDIDSASSSEVRFYLETGNGRAEAWSIWLSQ